MIPFVVGYLSPTNDKANKKYEKITPGKAGSDMDSLTNKAIKQIQNKNYGERFLNDGRPRVYLGVGFAGKEIGYKKLTS
ncbi:hypothetical protein THIOM_004040 [Candidatus Thiomargarita nelsonii]|uniref:Uncharacterized protein n=1 Tax=Candidatus Thiomargarita nelsonii TaxID=1003181 RepID=A0A0A6P0T6_9GAMM|nr:hypothetical protein THIOM_004040 [Candidatus Thiomargarita nelsonii]